MKKMRFAARVSFQTMGATLAVLSMVAGCGGGGGSAPSGPPNPFAGNYNGVYFVTSGAKKGDARFLTLSVRTNGALSSASSSLNAPAGTVRDNGEVGFTRREGDKTTTTANGQVLQPGVGTLLAKNTGGDEFMAAVARANNRKTTFDGNYYGTTRVRSGASIGTVNVVAIGVTATGEATIVLSAADGTTRQFTGTANLATGALTATDGAGADAITFTLQLAKTGQAGGAFDTTASHGTVALNKSLSP
jgi:hypothetical protein